MRTKCGEDFFGHFKTSRLCIVSDLNDHQTVMLFWRYISGVGSPLVTPEKLGLRIGLIDSSKNKMKERSSLYAMRDGAFRPLVASRIAEKIRSYCNNNSIDLTVMSTKIMPEGGDFIDLAINKNLEGFWFGVMYRSKRSSIETEPNFDLRFLVFRFKKETDTEYKFFVIGEQTNWKGIVRRGSGHYRIFADKIKDDETDIHDTESFSLYTFDFDSNSKEKYMYGICTGIGRGQFDVNQFPIYSSFTVLYKINEKIDSRTWQKDMKKYCGYKEYKEYIENSEVVQSSGILMAQRAAMQRFVDMERRFRASLLQEGNSDEHFGRLLVRPL
jgi:hypothetical protein